VSDEQYDYYDPRNDNWRSILAAFNREHGPWHRMGQQLMVVDPSLREIVEQAISRLAH
jgi:hypothetical protein